MAAKRTLEGVEREGGEEGATPLADNNALMLLSTVNIYKPAYAHTKKKKSKGKERKLLIWRRDASFPSTFPFSFPIPFIHCSYHILYVRSSVRPFF